MSLYRPKDPVDFIPTLQLLAYFGKLIGVIHLFSLENRPKFFWHLTLDSGTLINEVIVNKFV